MMKESKFAHITKVHPCFNEKMHDKVGRIHVPIAPKCNIQCNFCNRKIDKCEHRPGVSKGIMTPEQAADRVDEALKEFGGNLRVVGIAGPGIRWRTRRPSRRSGLSTRGIPSL